MKDGMKIVGWIYFVLSFIGAVVLFANASTTVVDRFGFKEQITNYNVIAIGFVCLLFSSIVLFICLAVSKILDDNEKILKVLGWEKFQENEIKELESSTIECPNCHKTNPGDRKYCRFCEHILT